MAHIVADKLQLQRSPEPIAGLLKHTYPCDENCHVSHETRSLLIQGRGALKKELLQHPRQTDGMRRSRHHTQKTDTHVRILDAVAISERPAMVEDRVVPGHREGDLLFGSATLVERQTRYVMLAKVTGKDTETVVNALVKNTRRLPQELYRSLTWGRGNELADHKHFTVATPRAAGAALLLHEHRTPWAWRKNMNALASVIPRAGFHERP